MKWHNCKYCGAYTNQSDEGCYKKPVEVKDFCKRHKPANKTMSYLAHREWMERKIKQGHKQRQCPDCGRWLFKCEM